MSIVGKPENLGVVVMLNEVGVPVQLLWQLQAKTARETPTTQGVVEKAYV